MKLEKQSLWETLAETDKPVILYGTGSGADKILDFCAVKDIKVSGIFASGGFVRGQSFRGFEIKKFSEIQELYGNGFCILLAFATRMDIVIKKIYELNDMYELYVPNFPVFGEQIYFDYDYYLKNREETEQVYDLLADAESRNVYENAINFFITGKLEYLTPIESEHEAALDLLELRDGLHYIDLGAYDGDTIFELLRYLETRKIDVKKITAFEPDIKNFAKLQKKILGAPADKCELYNLGAWSHADNLPFNAKSNRSSHFEAEGGGVKINPQTLSVRADSVDNIMRSMGSEVSGEILIKYDVEGAEFEALAGSREIIKRYSPELIVSLYHKTGDIFRLPLYIKSLNPNYKFYLRKHKYIPCWDLNLYAAAEK